MIVDSSVWIGFLRGGETDVEAVSSFLKGHNRAAMIGSVLQEVLQGIRDDGKRQKTREFLLRLPFLETKTEHYTSAADTYAALRSRGITVPSVDVLIAATAAAYGHEVLTRDRHFMDIRQCLDVKVRLLEGA